MFERRRAKERAPGLYNRIIDRDSYLPLTLKYHESTNEHRLDIKEELYADLILQGAPIMEGEEYFVGVLTEDEEGKVSPLFITEGVFGE